MSSARTDREGAEAVTAARGRGPAGERVVLGRRYHDQPAWKRMLGVPLIYLPLLTTLPFVAVGVLLVRLHLKYVGAMNVRPYWSFVPSWISHRYRYGDQITYRTGTAWHNLAYHRWFWIFNCKLYCPLSVALFRYSAYLVEIVENWWCPFNHDQKSHYRQAAIDQSYWHICPRERGLLHPDDRENPTWNDEAGGAGQDPPRG